MIQVASCMAYRWQGQTTAVTTDPRDGHVLLPKGVPEQVPPAVAITSKRALQSNKSCFCSHSPGNSHTLLFLLPNALITLKISLELTITSQGPATRGSLCHLSAAPCYCQEPSKHALTSSSTHYLLLPGNTPSALEIMACSN